MNCIWWRHFLERLIFEAAAFETRHIPGGAAIIRVELSEEIPLREGERFALLVHINTPDVKNPVAVEYRETRMRKMSQQTENTVLSAGMEMTGIIQKKNMEVTCV